MTRRLAAISICLVAMFWGGAGLAGAAPPDAAGGDPTRSGAQAVDDQKPDHSAVDGRVFEPCEYRDAKDNVLRYRLLKPAGSDKKGRPDKYPLLVFLHGIGERGTDNRAQLAWGRAMMRSAAQDHKAFVLAPQCPPDATWTNRDTWRKSHAMPATPTEPMRLLAELIERMKKDRPIDPDRIYVMGLSMGGFGTWEMILRWPERFAAAVPICGGGDESKAKRIVRVPIWAFHGSADWIVPPERSRDMIAAIRKAGGKPKYTEYPGVGHASWLRAFAEPELLKWLFTQRRGRVVEEKPPAAATPSR